MLIEPLLLFDAVFVENRPITELIIPTFSYRSDFLNDWYSSELKPPQIDRIKIKTENKPNGKRGSGVQAQELETFKVGKIKSIVKYLFAGNPNLLPHMKSVMQLDPTKTSAEDVLRTVETLVRAEWQTPQNVLVDAFSKRNQYT